jgi:hypothetical protein
MSLYDDDFDISDKKASLNSNDTQKQDSNGKYLV